MKKISVMHSSKSMSSHGRCVFTRLGNKYISPTRAIAHIKNPCQ